MTKEQLKHTRNLIAAIIVNITDLDVYKFFLNSYVPFPSMSRWKPLGRRVKSNLSYVH